MSDFPNYQGIQEDDMPYHATALGRTPFKFDYRFGEIESLLEADPYLPVWDFMRIQKRKCITSTTNDITTVSSSSASDVGKILRIYGIYLNGDGKREFITQTVTLNGQNKVTLPQPLFRAMRLMNANSDLYVGNIFIYTDTTISGGVPVDLNTVKNCILIDTRDTPNISKGQSQRATICVDHYNVVLLHRVTISMRAVSGVTPLGTSTNVDFKFVASEFGGVLRQVDSQGLYSEGTTAMNVPLKTPRIILPDSDLLVYAKAVGGDSAVSVTFDYTTCNVNNVFGHIKDYLIASGVLP